MTAQSRPILRWHGGKWRIAPWIIERMPPHKCYVEPFGGGASVLLRKPRSRLEVYNDLDASLVRLFRVLRTRAGELSAAVSLTPFARDEFAQAYKPTDDDLEHARRFLIRSHMGFGSNGANRITGFRAAGLRAGPLPVHQWTTLPHIITSTAERLRGVVIENRPAIDVMQANDGETTLHYVDPPYMAETRSDTKADYAHEMTDADHAALLDALCDLRGTVILSGYSHPLYDKRLASWHRETRKTVGDRASARVEVLWISRREVLF